ncbi:hypothetical protein BX600DRAFT_483779 [Xylariales sp. PMI_506]|nr:hypothetical protein BX600DRAFT_483779 [Xylariales sp. PMI_506]
MSDSLVAQAIAAGRVPSDITEAYLDESRDQQTIAGIIFVLTLTTICVLCRGLVRVYLVKRFGLDDWLAFFSLVLLAIFVGFCIKLINIGSGRHYAYILYVMDTATQNQDESLDFVAHLIYTTALLFCRMSGLAFYHQICNMDHRFELAIKILGGVLITLYLPQLFLIIFHCLPVTSLWPFSTSEVETGYSCLAWGLVYSVNSAVSLLCDILLFGIPIAMLYILDMSRKRKTQLAMILLPGILVVAISVTRIALVVEGQWSADETWTYDPMLAIEVSEIGATLIALSIPGIKPFFNICLNRHGDSTNSGGGTYGKTSTSKGKTTLRTFQTRPHHDILNSQDNIIIKGGIATDEYELEGGAKDNGSIESHKGILVRVEFNMDEQKREALGDPEAGNRAVNHMDS